MGVDPRRPTTPPLKEKSLQRRKHQKNWPKMLAWKLALLYLIPQLHKLVLPPDARLQILRLACRGKHLKGKKSMALSIDRGSPNTLSRQGSRMGSCSFACPRWSALELPPSLTLANTHKPPTKCRHPWDTRCMHRRTTRTCIHAHTGSLTHAQLHADV